MLDRDERLAQRVNLERTRVKTAAALKTLTRDTGVVLNVEARTGSGLVCLSLKGVPLREVMDGLAAVSGGTWERQNNNSYLLRDYNPVIRGILPKNDVEERITRAGLDFAARVDDLPPRLRQALMSEDDPYQVTVSQLPPKMQNALRQMMAARMDGEAEKPTFPARDGQPARPLPVGLAGLRNARVQFARKNHGVVTSYNVGLGANHGSIDMAFNNYTLLQAERSRRASSPNCYVAPIRPASEQDEKRDERLDQKVSLSTRSMRMGAAVMQLARKVPNVSFISYESDTFPEQVPLRIPTMRLRDALDRIVAAYPMQEWHRRQGGLIVARVKVVNP